MRRLSDWSVDDGFSADDPLPALGHRLTLAYAPPIIGGSFEARVEYDVDPTNKQEYEFGINRALPYRQSIGISFFRHEPFNAPNDQFSVLRLKYQLSF